MTGDWFVHDRLWRMRETTWREARRRDAAIDGVCPWCDQPREAHDDMVVTAALAPDSEVLP